MLFLRIFFLLILSSSLASASQPSAELKFKNLKVSKGLQNRINKEWSLYLKSKDHILHKSTADGKMDNYRSDQSCIFNGELLESGAIDLDTLKLQKHQQNYSYNLAAIEFLRAGDYKFSKRIPNKKLVVDFRYYSF